jgi:hypothetical protein
VADRIYEHVGTQIGGRQIGGRRDLETEVVTTDGQRRTSVDTFESKTRSGGIVMVGDRLAKRA